jgi:hypothetical protein
VGNEPQSGPSIVKRQQQFYYLVFLGISANFSFRVLMTANVQVMFFSVCLKKFYQVYYMPR